ncbi:MAG: hypothetical protein R3F11_12880 [Verrucomicrobiales bacterium]
MDRGRSSRSLPIRYPASAACPPRSIRQQPTFGSSCLYATLAINLQNFGIDQSYVQRYATARSDRDAARSVWLGALLYLPVPPCSGRTALFAFTVRSPTSCPLEPPRERRCRLPLFHCPPDAYPVSAGCSLPPSSPPP